MAVDVVLADNQVLFRMDRVLFFSRILDGIYPDTSKIIPQHYKTELILHTEAFTDAIERTYLLSREEKSNIAHLVTKENGMVEIMSSSSELGKVTERLEAEHLSGDLVRIAFNSKYMLDVLKVMNTERLHIGFTGAMSPIILKPADEESCLHLILPYRTSGVS
jgi:DNA polymerase-3 subunit beta